MKAIVFDLDGTLLDTLADIADAMNEALGLMGYPPHPVDAYRHFVGDGMETLVKRVLPEGQSSAFERCLALMKQSYGAGWRRKTQAYPGIPALLDELRAREIRLCVLSNKPHDLTLQCVGAFLGMERFERVYGVGPQVPKKPDPSGLKLILKELDLPTSQLLYVGDTNTDMLTATRVGVFAVGVSWGFRPRAELISSGANRVIDLPAQLLELL